MPVSGWAERLSGQRDERNIERAHREREGPLRVGRDCVRCAGSVAHVIHGEGIGEVRWNGRRGENDGARIQPTTKQLSTAIPAGRKLPCDSCPGRSIGICTPLDDRRLALLLALGAPCRWKKGQTQDERFAIFGERVRDVMKYAAHLSQGGKL